MTPHMLAAPVRETPARPGQYELRWGRGEMLVACPGCGAVVTLRVGNPKPPGGHLLTGDPLAPTLKPALACGCGWAGTLTHGVFSSC